MAYRNRGRWLRPFWGAATGIVAAAICGAGTAVAAGNGQHTQAMAAMHDLQAAVAELNRASGLTISDEAPYKTAAQRALNAVVGKDDSDFKANAGNPGDAQGALGHLNALLHEAGDAPWKAGVAGVLVNASVAQSRLLDTLAVKDLDDFQVAMTGALEALDVALGRDSATGALGGLQGALATTALGVPDGATTVPGCALPAKANGPAYGVTQGHLLYVALPAEGGEMVLPQSLGVGRVTAGNGMIVLHTAAAGMTKKLCPQQGQSQPSSTKQGAAQAAAQVAAADPPKNAAGGSAPKLYTQTQAKAGEHIAKHVCAVCHGPDLQGQSGPAIAGTAFLKKAKALDWTVHDLRSIVTNTMPRNNPGSLTKKQYADVLAYLLADNCYPPGQTKFPTQNTPKLKHAALKAPQGVKPTNAKLGTCPLQTAQTKGAQTTGTK